MPELPEVETIKNGLGDILFQEIHKVTSSGLKLRGQVNSEITNALVGKIFTGLRRRAKFIIIELNNDLILIFHLGMTGKLLLRDNDSFVMQKHDHLIIKFNKFSLVFNDIRRFGMVWLMPASEEQSFFADYGPEPLSADFSGEYLLKTFINKKAPIKSTIMDNRVVVGVGNIYASESLFRSAIHPLTPCNNLTLQQSILLAQEIVCTLQEAIKAGGSSLKDYVKSDGSGGYFQHNFLVYGKEGKECSKCFNSINKIKIAGRSSFFCPQCQIKSIV